MKTFPKPQLLVLSAAGLIVAGLVFAGCSKMSTTSDSAVASPQENTIPAEQNPTDNSESMMKPSAAPTTAQDPAQAETNEGAQLNALNKDSANVDQSFNDQAITVQ